MYLEPPYGESYKEQRADFSKDPEYFNFEVECDQWSGKMRHESRYGLHGVDDNDEVDITSTVRVGQMVQVPKGCSALSVMGVFENNRDNPSIMIGTISN